jgi:uncharacterized protein (DUF4415 family)
MAKYSIEDIQNGAVQRMTGAQAGEIVAEMPEAEYNALAQEDAELDREFSGAVYTRRGALLGRPRKEAPKEKINIRFDADVARALRALGRGWSTTVNDTMRSYLVNAGML